MPGKVDSWGFVGNTWNLNSQEPCSKENNNKCVEILCVSEKDYLLQTIRILSFKAILDNLTI